MTTTLAVVKKADKIQAWTGLESMIISSYHWVIKPILYKVRLHYNCPVTGVHQGDPLSPLIPWVNLFPSKFTFRNWFFPRKVSYFPWSLDSLPFTTVGVLNVAREIGFYTSERATESPKEGVVQINLLRKLLTPRRSKGDGVLPLMSLCLWV